MQERNEIAFDKVLPDLLLKLVYTIGVKYRRFVNAVLMALCTASAVLSDLSRYYYEIAVRISLHMKWNNWHFSNFEMHLSIPNLS